MNLENYLGKEIKIIIDRPLGSKHPKHGFIYKVNYGYIPKTKAPDGEEIDAYLIGSDKPVKAAIGKCIGIIHREDDNDDKLVVALPGAENLDKKAIMDQLPRWRWSKNTNLVRKMTIKTIKMGLGQLPFEAIESGSKTIEVRLNDEKRQQIAVGDIIEFAKEPERKEILRVKVVELLPFPTFEKLYSSFGPKYFRNKTLAKFLKSIFSIYTSEQENKYGVLGIKFEKSAN